MNLISRRRVISAGAVAGAAAFFPPFFSDFLFGGSAVQAANLSAGNLLAVVPVSNPSSAVSVNKLFPGLLSDPGFQKFLPMAFLVSNVSNKPIRAFSSRWTVTDLNGQHQMDVMHYFHRRGERGAAGVYWGIKGNRTRFTGRVPVIKAGATRLVTPFFNWSPSFYKKNNNPNWTQILQRRSRPEVDLSELGSEGTSVTMMIGGAITHDGKSLGPYDQDLARVYRVTRNAEHDEALAVLTMVTAGASQAQIKEQLLFHGSGLAFDIQPNSDLYYRVRQRQAKVLLRRLNKARSDQFVKTLEYLKNRSRTNTRSVSLV
jgi:hypothetical protein